MAQAPRESASTEGKLRAALFTAVACLVVVGALALASLRAVPGALQLAILAGIVLALGITGFALRMLRRVVTERADRQAGRGLAQQKLQAQLQRMDLLQQITRAIGERQDLTSIFQVVIGSVEKHLPADFVCGFLYDPATNRLTVMGAGSASEARARELGFTYEADVEIDKEGLARAVKGNLVYEPQLAQVPAPFPQLLASAGLGSAVAAPLLTESRVFGILLCARVQPDGFESGECEFLRQLSEHVALAAHQAQLYTELQKAYDDLRQTQRSALQQERLLALGQLASGIAHDINNAITPISLYTESILDHEQGLSATGRGHLEMVQRAIGDVAHTVARMREFYRQREVQTTLMPVDLNRLAGQVMDLTRARWYDMSQQRGVDVDFRMDMGSDIPVVMGVEGELRDALVNLVFNAIDAMPGGGQVTVRTRLITQLGPDNALQRQVKLEVVDTGAGMDEETRRRCMEPFFTTKGERGTGLGLAMVYGTMQRHSAEIEIDSEPGKGTSFRFVFPVQSMQMSGASVFTSFTIPDLNILVIDDDPLVSAAVCDRLRAEDHRVTAADGGEAGVAAFRAAQEQGDPFSVVITDLGMPHMDGRAVSAAIKAMNEKTPVIMLTGWGQRMQADGEIPPNVDLVLSKPPKLQEIRAALAHCLSTNG